MGLVWIGYVFKIAYKMTIIKNDCLLYKDHEVIRHRKGWDLSASTLGYLSAMCAPSVAGHVQTVSLMVRFRDGGKGRLCEAGNQNRLTFCHVQLKVVIMTPQVALLAISMLIIGKSGPINSQTFRTNNNKN